MGRLIKRVPLARNGPTAGCPGGYGAELRRLVGLLPLAARHSSQCVACNLNPVPTFSPCSLLLLSPLSPCRLSHRRHVVLPSFVSLISGRLLLLPLLLLFLVMTPSQPCVCRRDYCVCRLTTFVDAVADDGRTIDDGTCQPGGVRGFKERIRGGMSAGEALAASQAALNYADEPSTGVSYSKAKRNE